MNPESWGVLWAEDAARDLEQIVEYVAIDNPAAAQQLLSRIRAAAGDLVLFPERGRVVPELVARGVSLYRELAIRPYRLVYRASEGQVFVLVVFDGRRDFADVLFDRLIRTRFP
jgi:plasmid stabilization system protein ParE